MLNIIPILIIITLTTPTVIIQIQLKMENKQTYYTVCIFQNTEATSQSANVYKNQLLYSYTFILYYI